MKIFILLITSEIKKAIATPHTNYELKSHFDSKAIATSKSKCPFGNVDWDS